MPSAFDKLKQLGQGAALGAFIAGVLTLAWGDQRYCKRDDFDAHVNSPGHAQTAAIQVELASIKADLAWIKMALAQSHPRE